MANNWNHPKSFPSAFWKFVERVDRVITDLVRKAMERANPGAEVKALMIVFGLGICAGSLLKTWEVKSRFTDIKRVQDGEMAQLRRNARDQIVRMEQGFEAFKKHLESQDERQIRAVAEVDAVKIQQDALQSELKRVQKERDVLRTERDVARAERDGMRAKLAPFEVRAAQLYWNEPPAKALDSLYRDTQPDSFEVSINRCPLTNSARNAPVDLQKLQSATLSKANAFTISVRNTGKFPLKDLNILCSAPWLVASNLLSSPGWARHGSRIMTLSGIKKFVPVWSVRVDVATVRNDDFIVPPIIVKENLADSEPLPVSIQVFSARSDTEEFWVNLKYDPETSP